jgi:Protein of unknown function (DUF3224)
VTSKTHTTGRIDVKTYEPQPYDQLDDGPDLVEIHVTETFSGDIEGEGVVRFLQAIREDGSASFVGIERVMHHCGTSRLVPAPGCGDARGQPRPGRLVRHPRLRHRGAGRLARRRLLRGRARPARFDHARLLVRVDPLGTTDGALPAMPGGVDNSMSGYSDSSSTATGGARAATSGPENQHPGSLDRRPRQPPPDRGRPAGPGRIGPNRSSKHSRQTPGRRQRTARGSALFSGHVRKRANGQAAQAEARPCGGGTQGF